MEDFRVSAYRRKARKYGAIIAGLFIFTLTYGSLGFHLIEDANLFDSFYMSVITMSTVGFQEVFPLSVEGRMFAITTIFLGLLATGLTVGMVSNLIFEETLLDVFRGRKMEKQLQKLKGHFIVCGFGATGRSIVEELLAHRKEVAIIDLEPIGEGIAERCLFLQGDARKDEVLGRANITEAAGLASTLTEDADNVFVTLTAREMNPELRIVSRYKDDDTEKKLMAAGADQAVSPYRIGGQRLSLALTNPRFQKILDATLQSSSLQVHFSHVPLPAQSPVSGKTLRESEIRKNSQGALVVAVVEKNGHSIFNPNPDCRMDAVAELLVLGDDEQIRSLRTYLRSDNV